MLAIGASLAFGGSLYASARAGTNLPGAWCAAAARFIGVPVLTVPLAVFGRLRLTRRAVPLILTSGICEVLGFYAYTAGARHGIAVAAVLASQSGTFAALADFMMFGERLSKIQLCWGCHGNRGRDNPQCSARLKSGLSLPTLSNGSPAP